MKRFFCWLLAIVITLSAAYYQRMTGPTYPKRADVVVNGKTYSIKLIRSLSLDEPATVKLEIGDPAVSANIWYKRLNTEDPWTAGEFQYAEISSHSGKKEGLIASVPKQPPAGKLQYYIEITDNEGTQTLFRESPVVIRFKGTVPGWVLTPHILLMFFAMLLSTLAGLMALMGIEAQKSFGVIALALLLAGGMILGPVVQKYAFGEFWTGVPLGWDLTDNKTLLAVIFWILAVTMNRKKPRPLYTILAAVALLVIYSIPHSLFGSELDWATGDVRQGMITFLLPAVFFK